MSCIRGGVLLGSGIAAATSRREGKPVVMGVEKLENPRTSSRDAKEYRSIRLENGLRALLISDTRVPLDKIREEEEESAYLEEEDEDEEEEEESDENDGEEEGVECTGGTSSQRGVGFLKNSAAGLSVGAGSFSDPESVPGFAHFLEHMVFMGSEKFPDENSFENFIQNHGGMDNASTESETTVFYFETQRKHFREGLDRFAQFFICPLIKKGSMMREREAVDNEFQMALPSDYLRKQQLFGSLAKNKHPMGKFMWGNMKSLSPENMNDDEVRNKLIEFKDRHYTAQYMTLVVQSQDTLDDLQSMVEMSFSQVPNNGKDKETFNHLSYPFDTPAFNRLYKILPIQNIYEIDIVWVFPSMLDKYKVKPLHYLSWIIGHEGKGSLISYLRYKVWALNVTAGNSGESFEFNSTYSSFTVTIELTKSGLDHYTEVIESVFSYIAMLTREGPSERIYNEIKQIEELAFDYGDEASPIENVETICENMQFYPPERYLDGDDLMFKYDEALIKECTDALTDPSKVCIFLFAQDFLDDVKEVEPWFKTKYKVEDVSIDNVIKWKSVQPYEVFYLPEENKFIASNTELKVVLDENCKEYPYRIIDDPIGELFYKKDNTFNLPRANVHFLLSSDLLMDGKVEDVVALDIMVNCIVLLMREDTYPADLAQLCYSFYSSEQGIIIKINGLNDKLNLLISAIVSHLQNFEKELALDKFEAVKEQAKKNYFNSFIKPHKTIRELRLSLLQNGFLGTQMRHSVIDNVKLETVKAFASSFKSTMYIQGLVQGNVTLEEAKDYFAIVKEIFIGSTTASRPREIQCNEVPIGERTMRMKGINTKDTNTFVTNYYQLGPGDLKSHALLEILCMFMEDPVYDTLRNKEQLAYSVWSMLRNTFGVFGLSVTVNSQESKFKADYIEGRIDAFLKSFFSDKIQPMSEEEFRNMVEVIIKMKKAADVTLEEEMNRNWGEIVSREYLFDRHRREIQLFESVVTLEEMKSLMIKLISDISTKRKLSIQVVGSEEKMDINKCEKDTILLDPNKKYLIELTGPSGDEKFVKDLESFKKALHTHPVIHITK